MLHTLKYDSDSDDSVAPQEMMTEQSEEEVRKQVNNHKLLDNHIISMMSDMDEEEKNVLKRQIYSAPLAYHAIEPMPAARMTLANEIDVKALRSQTQSSAAFVLPMLAKDFMFSAPVPVEEEKKTCAISSTPPCEHNQWDRMSKKKHSITLRCKKCQQFWKTKLEYFTKCPEFYSGNCTLGDACPHPHIYSRAAEKHELSKQVQVAALRNSEAQRGAAVQRGGQQAQGAVAVPTPTPPSPLTPTFQHAVSPQQMPQHLQQQMQQVPQQMVQQVMPQRIQVIPQQMQQMTQQPLLSFGNATQQQQVGVQFVQVPVGQQFPGTTLVALPQNFQTTQFVPVPVPVQAASWKG